MPKIERAIIMAAGFGKRLLPLTKMTPKPLLKIHGVRMIDTIVEGLKKNGITEIYVVVGHLQESFLTWQKKYPTITLLENPYYKETNNISSLYVARNYLENAMILDGDQVIYNADILKPTFVKSGYNSVYTEKETTEWLQQVENGRVISCSRTGGKKGYKLYSISRWRKEDAKHLKKQVEFEFCIKKHQDIYWDDVPFFCYPNTYDLGVFSMQEKDVLEIDTLEELASIDASYKKYLRSTYDDKKYVL